MTGRREHPLVLAGLAGGLAWMAVWSWRDLVTQPNEFLGPALVGTALIAVTGALLRWLRIAWWLVLPAQLLVVTSWFHHRQNVDDVLGGWLPTASGLSGLADQVRAGASQVNEFAAPVGPEHAQAPVYLLFTALVVALVVDLIGCGLRRAPWAGLPVLVALTVPISVLDTPVDWPVLGLTALLYLATIAYAESEGIAAWSQGTVPVRGDEPAPTRLTGGRSATAIGLVTTISALIIPAFLPVGPGLLDRGSGPNKGGGSGSITLTNPLVDLRRDLQADERIPLLEARTDARDTSYLRLAVLNRFDGATWSPSTRNLPDENIADGGLPSPDGLAAAAPGVESDWILETSDTFFTTWLPTPFPIRSISIDQGNWRYDRTTLDIANTDRFAPSGIDYRVVGFSPTIRAAALDGAGTPPTGLRVQMTDVPDLDPRVTGIARTVTEGADTDYAKAVKLQNWFRNDGGFEYSLDAGSGQGMSQLVRFLTVDKTGYCEQFAAAMAVMARSLNIPARVVVGFLQPGRIAAGSFQYTTSDLHAWPEIYFPGNGWVRFEPTPSSRTGTPPSWTRDDVEAPAAPTPTASPTRAAPTPTIAPRQQETPTTVAESSSRAPLAIGVVLVIAVALLLALPSLVRTSQRRRRLAPRGDGRTEAADLWNELRATAVDLRAPWPEERSVRTVARALEEATSPDAADREALGALVDLVERARYRRTFELDEQTRTIAVSAVERWSALLAAAAPRRQVRLARWFPRSVLERAGFSEPVGTTTGDTMAADEGRDLTEVG